MSMELEELLARATALEAKAAALLAPEPVEPEVDPVVAELQVKIAALEDTIELLEASTPAGVDPVADFDAGDEFSGFVESELETDFDAADLEAFADQLDAEAEELDGFDFDAVDDDALPDAVLAGEQVAVPAAVEDGYEALTELEVLQARRASLGA